MTRFSPFNDIARFEPFSGLEDMFRDLRLMPSFQALENSQSMKIDVSENETAYTVKAETSQVKEEKDGEAVVRSERFSGRQYRGFSLAHEIDAAHAVAKYQDGVLVLTLPKKSRNGTKQLTVD